MRRASRLLLACVVSASCQEAPNLAVLPSPQVPSVPSSMTITGTAAVGVNAGDIYIVAHVWDASGHPVGSIPVSFSSTAGSLQPNPAIADPGGVAQTTLHTTIPATVRAAAGSAVATVDVAPNPQIVQ
jgi:hypothetical protein